ncbi:DUF3616 domain-containing protein [Sphingobium sp. AS12]|uniref:DUF3616 domain-containing protein n=1 Tax=Sphingobium sp. AS12 TaxID=2849495 RepID=UPI001C3165E9|nr:DUF3616 domain-containing protein [Sphingobium sp. AS12]MBV2149165.1 DUF3616 domain-containing protein [Sphingobium sp. AS12]
MNDIWSSGWSAPAVPIERIVLQFGKGKKKKALRNFSAGTRVGDSLFLGADEHADIDRLGRSATGDWSEHAQFNLGDLLPLADPGQEVDLEGLSADDGWLWVLGSHARARPKVEKANDERIDLRLLADLKDTRARCLLGRIPLVEHLGTHHPVRIDGHRRAGVLPQDSDGNALAAALARDPLIAPFTKIPAKEGGVDIEGIAVVGTRVALGMRGPIIGGHGVILELEVGVSGQGVLGLEGDPVRRLVALEGLGVRDLKRLGDDLLILAGPTTGLSGPCAIYRWPGWVNDPPHDPSKVHLHRPERLLELPFGRGSDHPEGLALWKLEDGAMGLMVIYDSPSPQRVDFDARSITADVFRLP